MNCFVLVSLGESETTFPVASRIVSRGETRRALTNHRLGSGRDVMITFDSSELPVSNVRPARAAWSMTAASSLQTRHPSVKVFRNSVVARLFSAKSNWRENSLTAAMAASSSVNAVVVDAALDSVGEELVVTAGGVGLTSPPPVVHAPSVTAPATNGVTAHLRPPRFMTSSLSGRRQAATTNTAYLGLVVTTPLRRPRPESPSHTSHATGCQTQMRPLPRYPQEGAQCAASAANQ
jgi:hypothetical protein